MVNRFAVAILATMMALLAAVPAAFAQAPASTAVANGVGNARALEISVLGNRIEVGRAKANVHVETPTGTTVTGMAAGICNLLGTSTEDCNFSNKEESSSSGNTGDAKDTCLVSTPAVAGLEGILDLGVGCADSNSKVTDNKATGANKGRLAKLGVGLDLTGITSTVSTVTGPVVAVKDTVVNDVVALLNSTTAGLPGTGVAELDDVVAGAGETVTTVNDLLNAVLSGIAIKGKALDVSALEGTVDVTNDGAKTKIDSNSATLKIGLLAVDLGDIPALPVPVALPDLSDGLLQIEVTPSHAEATFNADSGICNSDAKSSLAKLKVANLLGGGGFTEIEVPDLSALNSILGVLGETLSISINKTTVSPPKTGQNGDTCSAYASGLEVHALKGISGGISLRVAAVDAGFGGNVVPQFLAAQEVKPPLPTTGGPTYLYWAAGMALAVSSYGAFQLRRKLARSAG